jgi:hypothetical protein
MNPYGSLDRYEQLDEIIFTDETSSFGPVGEDALRPLLASLPLVPVVPVVLPDVLPVVLPVVPIFECDESTSLPVT